MLFTNLSPHYWPTSFFLLDLTQVCLEVTPTHRSWPLHPIMLHIQCLLLRGPFGLKEKEERVKRSKVELAQNKLIFFIKSTLFLLNPNRSLNFTQKFVKNHFSPPQTQSLNSPDSPQSITYVNLLGWNWLS